MGYGVEEDAMYCRRNNTLVERCPQGALCPVRFDCLVWKKEQEAGSERSAPVPPRGAPSLWGRLFRHLS
jgi:hypothetical protein